MFGMAGSSSRRTAWRRGGASGGASVAPYISHPRFFPRWQIPHTLLQYNRTGSTGVLDTGATNLSEWGVADDTNFSANTWKTILSVTGSTPGVVSGIFSPMSGGTHTVDLQVTVDSQPAWAVSAALAANQRLYLGPLNSGTAITAGILLLSTDYTALNGAKDTSVVTGSQTALIVPPFTSQPSPPLLLFQGALLVEMRTTATLGTSGNRTAGVLYRMLT